MSLEGDWLELSEVSWWKPRRIHLPREFYLRELHDLDLTDPQALLEFTRRYGVLPSRDWSSMFGVAHRALAGAVLYANFDVDPHPLVPLAQTVRAELERRTGMPFSVVDLERRDFFHLDEVRMYAETVRDMVKLWRVVLGQLRTEEVTLLSRATLQESPGTVRGAAQMLTWYLNTGLSEFTVHAACLDDDLDAAAPYQVASTYGVCCLQFANHIAERAVYRHCAACGRLFVRKEDPRYTGGQNRVQSGVKFCSDTCTNRVAKRRELARKRSARAGRESPHG